MKNISLLRVLLSIGLSACLLGAQASSEDAKNQDAVVPGEPIDKVDPKYAGEARKKKLQGTIVLDGYVGKDGRMDSLSVVKGDPILAKAALDGVSKWRYEPYRVKGKPAVTR